MICRADFAQQGGGGGGRVTGNVWTEGIESIDDGGAEAAGLAGCCAAHVRSREVMSGIILAADSVIALLLQHGNQSL